MKVHTCVAAVVLGLALSVAAARPAAAADQKSTVEQIRKELIDFLIKRFRDQDLLDVVNQAVDKDCVRRRASEDSSAKLREGFESLTIREREVMACVVTERLNEQIAGEDADPIAFTTLDVTFPPAAPVVDGRRSTGKRGPLLEPNVTALRGSRLDSGTCRYGSA